MTNKYNIGDKVWFIGNNKIETGYIESIHIRKDGVSCDVTDKDGWCSGVKIKESRLFKTKEDLLKSL